MQTYINNTFLAFLTITNPPSFLSVITPTQSLQSLPSLRHLLRLRYRLRQSLVDPRIKLCRMLPGESNLLNQVIRQQIDKRTIPARIELRHVVELVFVKVLGRLIRVHVGGVGADVCEFEVECWLQVVLVNLSREQ